MSYRHGDNNAICDNCGRTMEISIYSSFPMGEITRSGWKYDIIVSEPHYKFAKIMYNQPENKVIVTCDHCIIIQERNKKIKKIVERMNR